MKNYIFVLLFTFLSCANIIPPNGGPKDSSAPIVLKSSPSNQSIYFTANSINIYFDENVTINNKSAIHTLPDDDLIKKINSKGKVIEINLKKELRKNTTYLIDFQGSIIDLNEGNKLKDFKYVFSTGDNIDSSVIHGSVTRFDKNSPIENGLVGLYIGDITNNFDSIINNQKPDFFTFTNENGNYNYSNLKNGIYTLMCIKDENLNLKYEINELVSMPLIINLQDSLQKNVKIFLDERGEKKITKGPTIDTLLNHNDSVIEKLPGHGLLNLFFSPKLYENKHYLGQIVDGERVLQDFYINDSIVTINKIQEGIFQLKIIHDLNKNKKWDTGNIKTLKAPEEIYFFKDSIKIRANWELNLNINI